MTNDAATALPLLYRQSSHRLLLLDYDGTLVPFFPLPELAKPGQELLRVLQAIASDPANTLYIISGRDSYTLESWLGALPIHIIAEHGAKIKHPGAGWTNTAAGNTSWKEQVVPLMETFVARCPGSFIEHKDFSAAWHYRNAEDTSSQALSRELLHTLGSLLPPLNLQALDGHKVVEVRSKGVDKGVAAGKAAAGDEYDFILAMGDDRTDEDMFLALAGKEGMHTIKVGTGDSAAEYRVERPEDVLHLLQELSA